MVQTEFGIRIQNKSSLTLNINNFQSPGTILPFRIGVRTPQNAQPNESTELIVRENTDSDPSKELAGFEMAVEYGTSNGHSFVIKTVVGSLYPSGGIRQITNQYRIHSSAWLVADFQRATRVNTEALGFKFAIKHQMEWVQLSATSVWEKSWVVVEIADVEEQK